tara:strand:- start:17702 stop:18625 length:924 start_codon:yes stop_codon:yes gene_type:complete
MDEIKQLKAVVFKNIKSITKIVFTSCFVIFIYTYFVAEKKYISTSNVFVFGEQSSSVSELKSLAMQFGVSSPVGGIGKMFFDSPDLIAKITTSRDALYPLINSEFLIKNEIKTLKDHLEQGDEKHIAVSYKKLKRNIGISIDKRSGIISYSIISNDPQLSYDINSKLIEIVNQRYIDIKKAQTTSKREFISERLISFESQLKESEEEIKNFKELNRFYNTSPELTLELNTLSRNNRVIEQMYILLKEQLETTKIEEVENAEPLIIIDKPNIPHKKHSPSTSSNLIYTFLLSTIFSILYYNNREKKLV